MNSKNPIIICNASNGQIPNICIMFYLIKIDPSIFIFCLFMIYEILLENEVELA